jgi:hypothetical protein
MKFITSENEKVNKPSNELLFDIKGEQTDGVKDKVYSKSLSVYLGNDKTQNKFFIRTFNNVPFDPLGSESGRQIWNRTAFRQVSKNTFEAYNSYLSTKNKIFWTKTNRGYING